MPLLSLALLLLAAVSLHARAQECPSGPACDDARAVVRDLQRIVAHGGVDESYATTICGIKQWINPRGQERANPIILLTRGVVRTRGTCGAMGKTG